MLRAEARSPQSPTGQRDRPGSGGARRGLLRRYRRNRVWAVPAPRGRVGIAQHRGTPAIGEYAKVADPHESRGDDVQKKPEEFVDGEPHDLDLIPVGVVPPAKADLTVLMLEQTIIRERDAMRVAPEIVEDLGGSAERALRVDHPVNRAELSEEGDESRGLGKRFGAAGEEEFVAGVGLPESG